MGALPRKSLQVAENHSDLKLIVAVQDVNAFCHFDRREKSNVLRLPVILCLSVWM
jgi:hypothetical protein